MATFVTVQPIEGEAGVTAVTVTAPEYTGRKQRTDTVTFTTASNKSATVTVTQSGKDTFFTTHNYDQSVVKYGWIDLNGGSGYIDISTNSRSFFFGWYVGGGEVIDFVEPTVTGATVISPAAGEVSMVDSDGPMDSLLVRYHHWKTVTPSGDPGADGTYTIRIFLTFPANNGESDRECRLKIVNVDDYGFPWTEKFTQSAAITVSQPALSSTAEGGSTQVTVTSPEHWDASVDG